MKIVTAVTLFNDAVGMRLSLVYSVIDEHTGKIISDNNRLDTVVLDQDVLTNIGSIFDYARSVVENNTDS